MLRFLREERLFVEKLVTEFIKTFNADLSSCEETSETTNSDCRCVPIRVFME